MLKSLTNNDLQSHYFDYLAKIGNISLSELSGLHPFSLKREESIKLWRLLIDRYDGFEFIKAKFNEVGRNCLNTQRIVITGKTVYYGCNSLVISKLINDPPNIKNERISHWMEGYKCTLCPHFNVCSFACLMERMYDKCDMRDVYQYYRNKA